MSLMLRLIFTPMYGGFTDCTIHAGRSNSSPTDPLLAFYPNKTKQHLQKQTYCHLYMYWALMKLDVKRYLHLGETQTCKNFFFYFSLARS